MAENNNINHQKPNDMRFEQNNKETVFSQWMLVMNSIFIMLLLSFASCSRHQECDELLVKADSLMNNAPDSALTILDSLEASSQSFSKSTLRRWQLLRLMAQNKCDTVFRSDSLQLVLTDYYDRHGTPNERMQAHYMLGRAYSDMGEAPRALQCYQEAIAFADTTLAGCDFQTLSRIYGQIACIYEAQHLYDEEIEALEMFSRFSLKAGDTFCFIKGQELKVVPYYAKDDTLACFQLTDEVHRLYMENGYEEKANGVYYTAIMILLNTCQYTKAHKLMMLYEKKSGFFDEKGEIKKGMEHYYYGKGLYYIGVHQTDSAELLFRKLQGYHINNNYEAYKGLLCVFHSRRDVDSIAKYSFLCEKALDSIQAEDQCYAVSITHSLYNYNRMERIASLKSLELERRKLWTGLISLFLLMVVIAGIIFFHKQKRKKEAELGRLSSERMSTIHKYEALKCELQMLQQDKQSIIEDKKKEIAKLSKQISEYKVKFDHLPDEKCEAAMQNDNIVLSFKEKAKAKRGYSLPNSSEWSLLKALIQENIPHFYSKVILDGGLTLQELRTCILCRLDFHTGEIAILLDTTPQRITNAKISANNNLFGDKKASSLKDNLKKI